MASACDHQAWSLLSICEHKPGKVAPRGHRTKDGCRNVASSDASNARFDCVQFVDDDDVRMIGVEAAGEGITTDKHAATLTMGSPGVLHGSLSYLLQDDEGQIIDPHSISAGCASVLLLPQYPQL